MLSGARSSKFIHILLIVGTFTLGFLGGVAAQTESTGGANDEHEHEHGEKHIEGFLKPEDFTAEQRIRIDRLFTLVVCKCPNENWSKSLAGCPDGCAYPQKDEIRQQIKAKKTDKEILDHQLMIYGPEVLARTPASGASGFFVYVLPFIILAILTVAVFAVLKRVIRPAADAAKWHSGEKKTRPGEIPSEDRDLDEIIEQELKEME